MRLARAAIRSQTFALDGRGAARGLTERAAIVLEVVTEDGITGAGEAAPLPGMSIDTIDAARDALETFVDGAAGIELASFDDIARLAASCPAPSARFAIETALADALARTLGTTIASLIDGGAEHAVDIDVAVVVDDPAAARAARQRNTRHLKLKVGAPGTAFADDLSRVRAIAEAAPGATLRLDANRGWLPDHVERHLVALAALARDTGVAIEFVEEPCRDAHRLLDGGASLAIPIALDESLVEIPPSLRDRALASPDLSALILKPTLLGGFAACRALAAKAHAAPSRHARSRGGPSREGLATIVTHTLEGPIGFSACVELARAIGGATAHGLAPYPTRRTSPGRSTPIDIAVAEPTHATVAAVHEALATRRPLALIHHALPPEEQARRRATIERAADSDPAIFDSAAFVLFTSGSTGAARGVVLSRAAIEASARASAAHLGWRDDDRYLVALSLAHAGGLSAVVRCYLADKPIALLEGGWDRARAAALLEDLASGRPAVRQTAEAKAGNNGCTLASLVPTQLADLLSDPAWRPPRALRAVLLGGAAASPALLDQATARGVPFVTTYGMTESFGQLATAPVARAGDSRAPLIALPGVELSAGTRDAPAPIAVRAPMLASRYVDGGAIAPRFETADLGFVENDTLHVVGRVDDVIVTGGEKVHPATVEAVLAATPGVREACAFGVPDPTWGQIVAAAVVADGLDLAAFARWHAALPPHARPREVAVVPALPLLATGKLDRRAAARIPRQPVRYQG